MDTNLEDSGSARGQNAAKFFFQALMADFLWHVVRFVVNCVLWFFVFFCGLLFFLWYVCFCGMSCILCCDMWAFVCRNRYWSGFS